MLLVFWHFDSYEIELYLLLENISNFKKVEEEELGLPFCLVYWCNPYVY